MVKPKDEWKEIDNVLARIEQENYESIKRTFKGLVVRLGKPTSHGRFLSYSIYQNGYTLAQVHFIHPNAPITSNLEVHIQYFKPYPTEKPKVKNFRLEYPLNEKNIERVIKESIAYCIESLRAENIEGLAKEAENNWRDWHNRR